MGASSSMALMLYNNMTTDDTFIFMQYARNVYANGEFSFNPGSPTYGFTSPLWLVLLSMSLYVTSDLILNAKVLSLLFYIGSIWTFFRISIESLERKSIVLIAVLLFSINPVFQTMALSGMESTLSVMLILLFFYFFRSDLEEYRLRWSPLWLSLSILARPETALIGCIAFLFFVVGSYRTGKARFLRNISIFAVSFVPLMCWLLVAYLNFGTIIPNPVIVKSIASVKSWDFGYILKRYILIVGSMNGIELVGIGLFGLIALTRGNSQVLFPRSKDFHMIGVWVVALASSYMFQKVAISPRYWLIASPFITLYFLKMLDLNWDWTFHPRNSSHRWAMLIFAMCVFPLFMTMSVYYPHVKTYNEKDKILREFGHWLNRNSNRGEGVASIDIGILGYYSERPVIDLTGLINVDILTRESTLNEYLKEKKTRFFLDRNPVPNALDTFVKSGTLTTLFTPVLSLSTESLGWTGGLLENERVGFTLYEMKFINEDQLNPVEYSPR
jgi:hypothetical protein